jgi:hypothetical protein
MSSDPLLEIPPPYTGHPNVAVPHFAFPFTLDVHGHANVLEQDTDAEILNCVALIASVPKGGLIDEPEFGSLTPPS